MTDQVQPPAKASPAKGYLDAHLIEDWRFKIKKLWTVRLTALFGLAYALASIWSGLSGSIPTWLFIVGGILSNGLVFVARVTKQPGVDE